VTRAISKGSKFVVLYGFIVDNEAISPDENLELVATSLIEYPLQ